jgi:hypothetical protein
LWRRPRPKLGCGAKERRKKNIFMTVILCNLFILRYYPSINLDRLRNPQKYFSVGSLWTEN